MFWQKGSPALGKIQWVKANLGVALVVENNGRKVNSRDEQHWRREELDGDEVPWVTKKLARGL
jgi:hypothetical protein